MLQRLGSSVPEGTKLVILNPGGNDLRACRKGGGECATEEEHRAVIEKIRDRLRARGIPVVMAKFGNKLDRDRQADGRHLTLEAHRAVAARRQTAIRLKSRGGRAIKIENSDEMSGAAGRLRAARRP